MSYATEITRLGLSPRPFNTNNAWGFGGMSGKAYALPGGGEIRVGRAYFRHMNPEAVKKVVTREGDSLFNKAGLDYLAALPTVEQPATKPRRTPGTQGQLF